MLGTKLAKVVQLNERLWWTKPVKGVLQVSGSWSTKLEKSFYERLWLWNRVYERLDNDDHSLALPFQFALVTTGDCFEQVVGPFHDTWNRLLTHVSRRARGLLYKESEPSSILQTQADIQVAWPPYFRWLWKFLRMWFLQKCELS